VSLHEAFWRPAILSSLAAVAISGCGPATSSPDGEIGKTDLGVTTQAITNNGHDYLFVKTPKTWQEAQSLCSANGYKLVTINDANEEAFLGTHQASFNLYNWWIGLNDIGSEGFFVWDGGFSSHANWYPGEPNNSTNGNEDCVADRFSYTPGGIYSEQWNDYPCSHKFAFICERDPEPTSNRGSYSYSASNTSSGTVGTFNHSVFLQAGQLFTVATCGVPGASGAGDTYLRVNNPSGQEIAANDDAGGACGLLSNISFVVATSGSYTIRAGCYSSGSCSGTVAYSY
jgi:hypothetical protein